MALHRFVQSRESTQREKDLLKSIKVSCSVLGMKLSLSLMLMLTFSLQDTDLSRYIPGKVKMSMPQVYKQQRK